MSNFSPSPPVLYTSQLKAYLSWLGAGLMIGLEILILRLLYWEVYTDLRKWQQDLRLWDGLWNSTLKLPMEVKCYTGHMIIVSVLIVNENL